MSKDLSMTSGIIPPRLFYLIQQSSHVGKQYINYSIKYGNKNKLVKYAAMV
jgi:hypothetical protein